MKFQPGYFSKSSHLKDKDKNLISGEISRQKLVGYLRLCLEVHIYAKKEKK